MEETQQLLNSIIEGIQDKKGHGIIVADLRKIDGAVCKYFVINHPSATKSSKCLALSLLVDCGIKKFRSEAKKGKKFFSA